MAKINSSTLVITVSEMVKDDHPDRSLIDAEMQSQIEAVVKQLADESSEGSVLVEVHRADEN